MKLNVLSQCLLIFALGVSLANSSFGQTAKSELTPENKSAIIESVLNQFFEDYPDEINSDEIILSSKNLDLSFVPKHSHIKLILLTPDEINAKAKAGRVDYLVFSIFEAKGSEVFVTLENLSTANIYGNVEPFFGHGFEWKGKKKSGKWIFECIDTSAFTSISGKTGEN